MLDEEVVAYDFLGFIIINKELKERNPEYLKGKIESHKKVFEISHLRLHLGYYQRKSNRAFEEIVRLEKLLEERKDENSYPNDDIDAYKKENNLPDSFRITFTDVSDLKDTVYYLESIEGVYSVSALTEVAEVITGIKNMAYIGGTIIIGLLIAVSLMIIGNTIKITVFSRRREVNIMKYVGATNGFIRLPFIVEGVSLGIFSGALSYGIIYFAYDYIVNWVSSQTASWFGKMVSELVPFSEISQYLLLGFIGGGAFIGLFGCVAFIGKHLKV